MDHVVYLDAESKELENLIKGNKSMIIRGAAGRKIPHGHVNEGDILYFINNNGEGKIKARGVVSSVISSDKLSIEESFKTIINYQDKLQLPDKQFSKLAGKQYLVLIDLNDIHEIEPFSIDKSIFTNLDDWLPVGRIEECIAS
jgi:hypothetical protein